MSRPVCPRGIRALLARVHPVDKSLLAIMLILLLQSAYSIFFPGGAGQAAEDIDIIVRTSAAAIFGYFLSANFIRHATDQSSPGTTAPRILETGADSSPEAAGPTARIGFSDNGTGMELPDSAPQSDSGQEQTNPSDENSANCLQVLVATGIGLFCLVTLLALRNLSQWGLLPAQSDSVAATVVQFRDFISGCVGFLIGCPTHSNSQTS